MKYSIIIPVYNAENTIRRCVDSLLDQNYADSEIILVNDGSQDGSEVICREYERSCETVRCISQQNGGVSSARNAGIDCAHGEYIMFVDSDDYVLPGFYSIVDKAIETSCADWIHFSSYVDNGAIKRKCVRKATNVCSREDSLPQIIESICHKTINSPWAKLYKRDIIEKHHIRFPVGVSIGEDRAFNIVYSFYVQSYATSEQALYVLNTENANSLSRKHHNDLEKQLDNADIFIRRELSVAPISAEEKARYREAIDFIVNARIYLVAKMLIRNHVGWIERQRRLMLFCREVNKMHTRYPRIPYCMWSMLPVRLYQTTAIDAMARVLMVDTANLLRRRPL